MVIERDLKINGEECNFFDNSLKSEQHAKNIQVCIRNVINVQLNIR